MCVCSRWKSSLGEDQDDGGEAAAQIQTLYEDIDRAILTGQLEVIGVSDMTKKSEHQEEPDLTPAMGVSEEPDPVEMIDGRRTSASWDQGAPRLDMRLHHAESPRA